MNDDTDDQPVRGHSTAFETTRGIARDKPSKSRFGYFGAAGETRLPNAAVAGQAAAGRHSATWRATPDDDEHYVYAIAFWRRWHSTGLPVMSPACPAILMCIYREGYTHLVGVAMRTNIEIDDALLSQAMIAAGLSTKRATVEESLRLLVRVHEQARALADISGLGWEGDLDEMRQGRPRHRT